MAGRKNNHYHYAEKFDHRRRRQQKLFMPRRAVVVAALVLLIFGLISTTFAAYVSSNESNLDEGHSIIVDVRTAKAQKDFALTGANADLAGTSYDVTAGAIVYFDTTGWDTSTYSKVQIMIGHGTYSSCYTMSRVGSTNLYYYTMPSWGGFTQLCFIANTSEWGSEGSSPNNRKTYSHYYTNTWGTSNLTNTKYVFRAADLSSNNSNLSSINDGSYNTLLNSTFSLYAATKTGSGSYAQSTAGGVATQAGTTKNTTSASSTAAYSTSTSSANPAVNYPMIGSAVTVSTGSTSGNANSAGTANKGYKFDHFVFDDMNGSNTHSGTIDMTSWKNENTYLFACFSEVMHNVRIANNIDSNVDTSNTASVGIATAKTINAPTKAGYTFHHWTQPSGTTVTSGTVGSSTTKGSSSITFKYTSTEVTAQNVTWTANYTINPPTGVSITGGSMKVGDSAINLNPQYTVASNLTANVTYSIKDENNQTVGTSVASVNSGNFTATKPGVYTVTISVTSTDGTRTSSAVTATATVTVSPAVPSWTLTMSGYDADGDLNNGSPYGSQNNPYLVTLGSNFSFTAAITNPPADANYVYSWYNSNDEYLGSGRSYTFGNATASEATTANIEVEVYCVVSYTGTTLTTTSGSIEKWYYIKSLIKSFEIPDIQKIYESPNDAKMNIEYNISSATGYDTSLYFSHDNLNFYQVDVAHGAFLGSQIAATAVYEYDPSAQIDLLGPKYFYLAMSKTGASAKTDVIHTTVGTRSSSASHPVYFIDNANMDLSTYRVMAFYVDGNGDLKYQTAQDVFKDVAGKTENKRFRVMIPSDATKISFAVAKRTKYSIPADSTVSPNYSADFYYAYTNYVTLEDDKNTISATAMINVGTQEAPLYQLTTSYLTYQSTN